MPVRDDRLRWALGPAAIAALRSQKQQSEYRTRLDGQTVLAGLRHILVRADLSIN